MRTRERVAQGSPLFMPHNYSEGSIPPGVFVNIVHSCGAKSYKYVTGHPVTVLLCMVKFHIRNNPDDSAHFRTLYRRSPNDSSVLLTKIQHISQFFKINGFDLDFPVEYCNIDSAQHLVCNQRFKHNIWRDLKE